jgi:hypothetical protein
MREYTIVDADDDTARLNKFSAGRRASILGER